MARTDARRTVRPMARLLAVAVVVIAAAGAITACGGSAGTGPVVGEGAGRFPFEALRDWVSYADHVAIFTVIDEREIPARPEEVERGEGLVGRDVTLRVDRTLWSARNAPRLPDEIHMTALGWVLQDGQRRQLVADDAPRVVVGQRYLAPLVRVEDDPSNPEWWPLAVGAQLPLGADDAVREPEGWSNALVNRLAGRSINAVRDSLTVQTPDPLAEKYHTLRPSERVRAVARERGNQSPPDPSENAP